MYNKFMSSIYNEILSDLSNSSKPLQDILFKLKILAHRLKNKNLAEFVNNELNGYKDRKIPKYRCIKGVLIGTVSNGRYIHKNTQLPTIHLKKHKLQNIETCEMPESLGTLVGYLETEEDNLSKIIPPELYGILSETFEGGYMVQRAYVPISKAQINGILITIRAKILDLMFAMENEFNETEMESLFRRPTKAQQDKANPVINNFFQTNFYSYGKSTQNTKIALETGK